MGGAHRTRKIQGTEGQLDIEIAAVPHARRDRGGDRRAREAMQKRIEQQVQAAVGRVTVARFAGSTCNVVNVRAQQLELLDLGGAATRGGKGGDGPFGGGEQCEKVTHLGGLRSHYPAADLRHDMQKAGAGQALDGLHHRHAAAVQFAGQLDHRQFLPGAEVAFQQTGLEVVIGGVGARRRTRAAIGLQGFMGERANAHDWPWRGIVELSIGIGILIY